MNPTMAEFALHVKDLKAMRALRMGVCKKCDRMTEFRICSACGCPVDTKTMVPSATCPLKKW